MRVGLAVEAHFQRAGESLIISVGGSPAQRHPFAGLESDAIYLCLLRADAADVRERHEDTEKLLAGERNAFRIFTQIHQRLGMIRQIAERTRNRVDDRVAPASSPLLPF